MEGIELKKTNWQSVRFGDMVHHISERVHPGDVSVDYYVGLEHLDSESLKIRRWGTPDDVGATKLRFYPGDIIFGKRRFYQRKLAVAEFEGICSAHAMVLRAKPKVVLPEFLPFFMQSETFFERAMSISVGSLSPTINWTTLKRQEFALPPLDEQRRIAEILWASTQVINQWTLSTKELIRARRVFLRHLYKNGINNQSTKETKIGKIPSNWKVMLLEELAVNGSLNGLYKPKSAYGSGVEMVHMGDLFANDIIQNDDMQCVNLTSSELENYSLEEGDLLFARRSIVLEGAGKCSIVGNLKAPIVFESSIIRIRPDQNLVNPSFLIGWFQSIEGIKLMRGITRRGAIAGIAASDLLQLPIPITDMVEQSSIVSIINEIDEGIQQLNLGKQKSANLQKSLMNEILTNEQLI